MSYLQYKIHFNFKYFRGLRKNDKDKFCQIYALVREV